MDLAELLARGPLPSHRALTLLHPLAVATHELHRRGRLAGLTDPRRIRLVEDELVAAPPPAGPRPDDTSLDDVRGLGAILYALLTGYWPLLPGAPAGPLPAPREPDGTVVEPARLRPGVALEVSDLAMAALGADSGSAAARLCTAGAVARVIEELHTDWTADLLPPVDDTGSDRTWSFASAGARPTTDPDTRRKLSLGICGLVAASLLTFGLLGTQAASAFGLLPSGPPPFVVGNVERAGITATPPAVQTAGAPGALVAAPPVAPAAPAAVQRPAAQDRERLRQQRERERQRQRYADSDDSDSDSDEGDDD